MENIEVFLSIAATALGLLITAITFISKFIKSAKGKHIADSAVKIGTAILPYIQHAETFAGYTGSEKKAYVLDRAFDYAAEKGLEFDFKAVSAKIDELITLTKKVNIKG